MKIAVIGLCYDPNLGDYILSDCVCRLLRRRYPRAQVDLIDIHGRSGFAPQTQWKLHSYVRAALRASCRKTASRWGIRDSIYHVHFREAQMRASFVSGVASGGYDAAVFAGGQLFMDSLSMDAARFVRCFQAQDIPVFFNACGLGVSDSPRLREELADALSSSCVRWISTRDSGAALASRYKINPSRVTETYDPALWASEVYPGAPVRSGILGLGVMYPAQISFRKASVFWIKLIRELESRGIPWKMFCNGSRNDYDYGRFLLRRMKMPEEGRILRYPGTPEELAVQISSFDSMISFRLHSHILAAAYGVPAVAVNWDQKLREFYLRFGMPERVFEITSPASQVCEGLQRARQQGWGDNVRLFRQKAAGLLYQALEEEIK